MCTEDLLILAMATVKSVKRCHTITELVVVWSVCSVCTSVTKSDSYFCNDLGVFHTYGDDFVTLTNTQGSS